MRVSSSLICARSASLRAMSRAVANRIPDSRISSPVSCDKFGQCLKSTFLLIVSCKIFLCIFLWSFLTGSKRNSDLFARYSNSVQVSYFASGCQVVTIGIDQFSVNFVFFTVFGILVAVWICKSYFFRARSRCSLHNMAQVCTFLTDSCQRCSSSCIVSARVPR